MIMELPVMRCGRAEFGELSADFMSEMWSGIPAVELREAVAGAAPMQRTWVRSAWDANEWRVIFHCEDADAWATLTEHDAHLYTEETVEILFDPVGDLESYYEIEVNPLGTTLDIVFRKNRSGYKGDWAWDCDGMRTLVRKLPGAWTTEIAIPFRSVAAVPQPGAQWRVNFCRIDRPSRDGSLPREISAWSPPLRTNFHTQERFGVVEFY